jgi:hypothetical protein
MSSGAHNTGGMAIRGMATIGIGVGAADGSAGGIEAAASAAGADAWGISFRSVAPQQLPTQHPGGCAGFWRVRLRLRLTPVHNAAAPGAHPPARARVGTVPTRRALRRAIQPKRPSARKRAEQFAGLGSRNFMRVGVLIVEDEFLLRVDAVCFMEDVGFTVYEASNADEAIATRIAR